MGLYENRLGEYRNIEGLESLDFPFTIEQIGTDYCKKDYIISRKNTELGVIGITLTGSGKIIQDNEEFITTKGSLFILKIGCTHEYFPIENWSFLWLNIKGNFNYLLELYKLKKTIYFCPQLTEAFSKTISSLLLAPNGLNDAQINAQSFVLSLLPKLKYYSNVNLDYLKSPEQRIKISLEKQFATNYSLNQICKEIGITERHAQRIFLNSFGCSPHNYILNLRFNEACSLLMNSDLTIEQVAFTVGFRSPKYFSTFFKAKSNLSPTLYKKMIRK